VDVDWRDGTAGVSLNIRSPERTEPDGGVQTVRSKGSRGYHAGEPPLPGMNPDRRSTIRH